MAGTDDGPRPDRNASHTQVIQKKNYVEIDGNTIPFAYILGE